MQELGVGRVFVAVLQQADTSVVEVLREGGEGDAGPKKRSDVEDGIDGSDGHGQALLYEAHTGGDRFALTI